GKHERNLSAKDAPVVALLELIAIDRIVEPIREIGEKLEVVVDRIGVGLQPPAAERLAPAAGDAEARSLAAERRVDRAKRREDPCVDRASRNLVCRAPVRIVCHERYVEASLVVAMRITHERVAPIEPFTDVGPRTVVAMRLHRVNEVTGRDGRTAGRERPEIAVLARPDLDQTFVEPAKRRQMNRAGRREVTDLRVIRAFPILEPLDELR